MYPLDELFKNGMNVDRSEPVNELDQYRQVHIFKTSEVLIEAPTDIVWPYLLEFSSFNDTFERVELLSGVQNTVGAISRLTKRKGEWWIPPFLVKIIHLNPGRQIVWKVFPEEGEAFSRYSDFNLRAVDQGTLFNIRAYEEHRFAPRSSEEEAKAIEAMRQASDRLHREVLFPNLKRLAEREVKTGHRSGMSS